jgi:hypothetical protein
VHEIEQAPRAQVAAPWFVEHGVPHAPQFLAFVLMFVSQPFTGLPSQSENPELQLPMAHWPLSHFAVAFAGEQTWPHTPQLSESESVFTSQPSPGSVLQLADGAMHAPSRHTPPEHVVSAFGNEHPLPQAPQLDGSVCPYTSHPVVVSWSQSKKPALQFGISQTPPLQRWFGVFSRLQAKPQVPQFAVLWERFASQPLSGLPSQSE